MSNGDRICRAYRASRSAVVVATRARTCRAKRQGGAPATTAGRRERDDDGPLFFAPCPTQASPLLRPSATPLLPPAPQGCSYLIAKAPAAGQSAPKPRLPHPPKDIIASLIPSAALRRSRKPPQHPPTPAPAQSPALFIPCSRPPLIGGNFCN